MIDAAERALLDEGVEAVSVRRLASELGASRQVVYTHFGGMHDVFEAVHRRAGVALTASVADLTAPIGSDERIVDGAHAYVEHARQRPAVFDLMFGRPVPGYVPSEATTEELRRAFRVGVVGLVAEWARANDQDLSPRDAVARARVYWSSIHGLVTLERAGHARPDETDALIDSLMAALLAGWRAIGSA